MPEKQLFQGRLTQNEPMSVHTSWRAGGCAQYGYFPTNLPDLAVFLENKPCDQVLFVGLGSNLLIRDRGFHGVAIFTQHALNQLEKIEPDQFFAESGLTCAKFSRKVAQMGYQGAEFLVGIPGTVGGALAMNAGCHGSETWDFVERVCLLDKQGNEIILPKSNFDVGYRYAYPKEDIYRENHFFAGAWFSFPKGQIDLIKKKMKENLAKRLNTQPIQYPNAGSVFRNPPHDHAARLIEDCNLKGHTIGGASVSMQHANFIVNPEGRANATDIENLIQFVQKTVAEQTGITLIPEVKIIGGHGSQSSHHSFMPRPSFVKQMENKAQ